MATEDVDSIERSRSKTCIESGVAAQDVHVTLHSGADVTHSLGATAVDGATTLLTSAQWESLEEYLSKKKFHAAQFFHHRGIDISYSLWCIAYVLWGYYGVEPPFGVLGAGYNFAWEILMSVYALFFERALPAESRFATRWLSLTMLVVTDIIMLSGLYFNGKGHLVFEILCHVVVWIIAVVAALLCAAAYRKRVWFAYKYSGYPVEVIFTSMSFYEWVKGDEQPPLIMMLIVCSMIPAILRTIQRPLLGKYWLYFARVMLYSHLMMFGFMLIRSAWLYYQVHILSETSTY